MRLPHPGAFDNKIVAVEVKRVTNDLKFDPKSKYSADPLINTPQ